jgi:putative NADH-flavin reductase
MKILLLGATGRTGIHIIKEAIKEGIIFLQLPGIRRN